MVVHMKFTISISLLLLYAFPLTALDQTDVDHAIQTAIERDHPRIIVTETVLERIRNNIQSNVPAATLFEALQTHADAILDMDPCERVMEGRRLLAVSREVMRRVWCLSIVYRVHLMLWSLLGAVLLVLDKGRPSSAEMSHLMEEIGEEDEQAPEPGP